MDAFDAIERNNLSFHLTPITIRDLFYLDKCPCDIYGHYNGRFKIMLEDGMKLLPVSLKKLIDDDQVHLFIYENALKSLIKKQQDNLVHSSRSMSIGNLKENAIKLLNLLTLNMNYLYQFPYNDEYLKLQYQSIKVLGNFLINNLEMHKTLYQDYIKQKHYYIFSQPMLSSLFLVGVLKASKIYSEREIENLFVTSYFKDIGMSSIPSEKFQIDLLDDDDKFLLSSHAEQSVKILQGRLSLTSNYFKIIEHHHAYSAMGRGLIDNSIEDSEFIIGFETMIVSIMDIIAAMISERPYRTETKLFDALELIKFIIADQHPREFKIIVYYFKKFF